MGVNRHTDKIMMEALDRPVEHLFMGLIGDLYARNSLSMKYRRANEYYHSRQWAGVDSIDINGKADLLLDLSLPLEEEVYRNWYDVIINGGTAEHVANQEVFFANIDLLAAPGAIIVHVAPEKGSFPNHSKIHYRPRFFRKLAEKYNYKILHLERKEHRQGIAIYVVYKKADATFQEVYS